MGVEGERHPDFDASDIAFAARGGKIDVCKRLLDAGSDIESIDVCGNAPIWRAVMANSMDVVSLLIERGANLDHENRLAITPGSILGQVRA